MNLAEPTIGDILDRLSILAQKEKTGGVLTEIRLLQHRLQHCVMLQYKGLSEALATAFVEDLTNAAALGAVNGRLWELHEHPELEHTTLKYAKLLNGVRRELARILG